MQRGMALMRRSGRQERPISSPGSGVHCPVCEQSFQQFLPFLGRDNARCPNCGVLERHRLLWLYFRAHIIPRTRGGRVLDIAPNMTMQDRFRDLLGDAYTSAGLQDRSHVVEDLFMDITDIALPDGSCEIVICYHVLEHVEEDAKAMRALCRILKDDGLAIICVPVLGDKTYEDPSITNPEQRELAFGQHDHVRMYGMDILDRLGGAGFLVEAVSTRDFFPAADARRYGFREDPEAEALVLCAKTANHPVLAAAARRRRIGVRMIRRICDWFAARGT